MSLWPDVLRWYLLLRKQEVLFRELVALFRNAHGDIQNAAREALLRLNVCSPFHSLSSVYIRVTGCSRRLSW